jgi:murein DD-endopeptidase MepM/ murein hydrolase activator NlpD
VNARRYISAGAALLALTAANSAEAAPRAELARLEPVPPALAGEVREMARVVAREQARRPAFPVDGEFNWGQGGAQFGASRGGRAHEGQDVFARTGTPLVAVRRGVVVETGDDGGRGNYVAIFSPDSGRTYVYLHMNEPSRVKRGGRVTAVQRIGSVGCTGSCFGDHLHFEVRRGRGPEGPAENPRPALRRWAAADRARATLPPGAH